MAVEVGAAYVSITPSLKGFTTELRRQVGDQSALGRAMGDSAGSSLEGSLLGAAKKAAVGVAAVFAGKQLFDFGLDTLRIGGDFQKVEVAFEGLIGDTEQAQAALEELKAFSARTPFDFPDIADAAKKFLAFGYSAEQIIPILQNVGDAAAVLGASSSDINLVTRALGQIGSKGRVQLEELNQIAEAFPGLNPIKILAEAINVSVPEFTNALSKPGGALTAFGLTGTQAVDFLVEGFGELNGAAGAMERQMRTLPGAVSNLKDTFLFLRNDLADPFLQPVADFVNDVFVPTLQKITPVLVALGQQFARFVIPLIVAFGQALPAAVDKFIALLSRIGLDITPDLQSFGTGLANAATAATGPIDAFRAAADRVAPVLARIGDTLAPVTQAFKSFAGPALAPVGAAFRDLFAAIATEVGSDAADALQLFVDVVVAALPVIADAIVAATPHIVALFGFLADHPQALSLVLPFPLTVLSSIAEIRALVEAALPHLRDFYQFVQDHQDGLTVAAAGLATFAGGVLLVSEAMLALKKAQAAFAAFSLATSVLGPLTTALPLLATPLGLVVVAVAAIGVAAFVAYKKIEPFREAVDAVARVVRDVAVDAFERFMEILPVVVDFVGGALTGAFNAVLDLAGSVGGALTGAFATVSRVVTDAAGGLASGFSGVAAAVIGFLSPIVAWFDANFVSTFRAGAGAVDAAVDLVRERFSALFQVVQILIGAARDLLGWLGPGLLEALSRVGAFLSDVGSVIAGIVVPGFRLAVETVEAVVKVLGAIVEVAKPVVGFFADTFVDVVVHAFQSMKSVVENTLGVLRGVFKILEGALRGDWSKIWDGITLIASSAVGVVVDLVKNLVVLLLAMFDNIQFTDMAKALGNLANVARDALWDIVKAVVSFIAAAGPVIALQLRAWADAFVDWVATTAVPGLAAGLGGLFAWLAGALAGMVPVIVRALAGWGAAFGGWVTTTALPAMIRETSLWLVGFITWVQTAAVRIAEATVDLSLALTGWVLGTALPWAVEASARFLAWVVDWVVGMGARIAEASIGLAVALTDWLLTSALPWVAEKSAQVLVAILSWIDSAAVSITAGAAKLATALLGWIADAVVAVPGQLAGIAAAVLGFVTGLPEQIAAAATGMWDGIAEAFRAAINTIVYLWNGLEFSLPSIDTRIPGIGKVGGFTLSTPDIPEFASGAVVTSPTLAWLGEVPRAQPEIVTPETLMRQVVRDAIAEVGMAGGRGFTVEQLNVTEAASAGAVVDEVNARLGWMLTTRNER